jgi:two-component system response regulator FixJ
VQSAFQPASYSGSAPQIAMAVDPISSNPNLMPFVCVVEPNATVARRISHLFDPAGVAVRSYADGQSLLADTPEDAVCFISEMTLPDMTGAELISALRDRGNHTPVILLAEESDVTAAVTGMRAGALDFIDKTRMERLLLVHLRRLILENSPGSDPQEK